MLANIIDYISDYKELMDSVYKENNKILKDIDSLKKKSDSMGIELEKSMKKLNQSITPEKIDKKKTTTIEVKNCFVTTNFNDKNYTYKASDVFKDKTLYNKKNVILSDYWNVSGITATDEEQKIIDENKENN